MRPFVQIGGLLAVSLTCLSQVQAGETQKRQFYSDGWKTVQAKTTTYCFKTFKYKVNKTDSSYKQQVVVYNPKVTKNYVHWYNPETKTYWARCPTVNHPTYGKQVKAGKDYWSILPKTRRKGTLAEIDDGDYGKITQNSPPLPGCTDNVKIDCPPIDLPEG